MRSEGSGLDKSDKVRFYFNKEPLQLVHVY